MTTRLRPPRGRLRLQKSPPPSDEENQKPLLEVTSPQHTSRSTKEQKLAERDQTTTPPTKTTPPHNPVPAASSGRVTVGQEKRAPGIQTQVFKRSPQLDPRLDPATPAFKPGVPYIQKFQEAAPECGVRPGVSFADAARTPPSSPETPALTYKEKQAIKPPPKNEKKSKEQQKQAKRDRPSPDTTNRAGPNPEGARAGSDEIKLGGIVEGLKVTFPLPIPGKIICNICRPPVSWKRQKSKHRDALKHLQEHHNEGYVAAFRCTTCGYSTTTLHAGNRHLARSCAGVRALEEAPQDVGPTELRTDGTLVLMWPARPSSCPIQDCPFTTSASGVTVATSIDHHLARRHQTQMGRRLWKCAHCNKEMAGLETREHNCGGPRPAQRHKQNQVPRSSAPAVRASKLKPITSRSLVYPTIPSSSTQDEHTLNENINDDGDDAPTSPAATPSTSQQPETPRQPSPAPCAQRGGEIDPGRGEDHSSSSLPPTPTTWPQPRDRNNSAGQGEDDQDASLPYTSSGPRPRDEDTESTGQGEDHDANTSLPLSTARISPRSLITPERRPAAPPSQETIKITPHELSPTIINELRTCNISGDSDGGAYINPRVSELNIDSVGTQDISTLSILSGEADTNSPPRMPHTAASEGDDNNSPPTRPSPADPRIPLFTTDAGHEGPPQHQDQPVVTELDVTWDDTLTTSDTRHQWIQRSPDLFPDDENDSGDIPQPGWQTSAPESTPPPPPGGSRVSGDNQEGDSPGDEEDTTINNQDEEEAITRAGFSAKWKEAFLGCHRGNLDEIIEQFSKDLVQTANKLINKTPVDNNHNNISSARIRQPPASQQADEPAPFSSADIQQRRRRNQHRHQQRRARRYKHHRPEDASKIQKLYGRYPRKALRKVLDEDSPYYSGGRDRLESYVAATYHKSTITPREVAEARRLYTNCEWEQPTDEELQLLQSPPSAEEIVRRLRRTTNTSPGMDQVEWRHLKAIDKTGSLLQTVLAAVHALGIPSSWRKSKTVLIHKKGETDDPSNFRPISLLSSLYKLYSGVLAQRLTKIASSHGWLSAEQKGFLPGVRGIQEHTFLLQTAIDEAKKNLGDLSIAWLDLTNAFGSIPHPVLMELFNSLPIPELLRYKLADIYTDNQWEFVCEEGSVPAHPVTGVRQGDGLSPIIFNLASEPLVRSAQEGQGVEIFGRTVRSTTYADDSAVLARTPADLQATLNRMVTTARKIGLRFNPNKCSSLTFRGGIVIPASELQIQGGAIKTLEEDETEVYLGIPTGAKLLYRPGTDLPHKMNLLQQSLLAPWQKLEALRSQLIPSLSHHLASGRVKKDLLRELDDQVKHLLRNVARVPVSTSRAFFHANRRVGGMAITPLVEDADIWTVARATQLLSSEDEVVSQVAWSQLRDTITSGLGHHLQPNHDVPVDAFLSGDHDGGLYSFRHHSTRANLWTRARHAASRLHCRIDASAEYPTITAEDVSTAPAKAVKSLRLVSRERWTAKLLEAPVQGRVARGLDLDKKTKDVIHFQSSRSSLSFTAWKFWAKLRCNGLAVRGAPGSTAPDKLCRFCRTKLETTSHVISACPVHLPEMTGRHDRIQDILTNLLWDLGIEAVPNARNQEDGRSIPDVTVQEGGNTVYIDVTVPFDDPANLYRAATDKTDKYGHLGTVLPLVVGALGSWIPENDKIASTLEIPRGLWNEARRKMRQSAIEDSCRLANDFLNL